jgi:hypothetical protein
LAVLTECRKSELFRESPMRRAVEALIATAVAPVSTSASTLRPLSLKSARKCPRASAASRTFLPVSISGLVGAFGLTVLTAAMGVVLGTRSSAPGCSIA